MPAPAHRLDEYLQATIVSIDKDKLHAEMTLTPGVAVFPRLIAQIDTNADGAVSEPEQRAYAAQVLRDLSLAIDGHRLIPQLLSIRFPTMDEMKEGRGEIQLDFSAELPPGGASRSLIIDNHHQSSISAYQVNCLVPSDPELRVVAQNRNYTQSHYELDYTETGASADAIELPRSSGWKWLGTGALFLCGWLALLWRQRASGGSDDNAVTGRRA